MVPLFRFVWRSLVEASTVLETTLNPNELQSELLKGGYIGDYIGNYKRGYCLRGILGASTLDPTPYSTRHT